MVRCDASPEVGAGKTLNAPPAPAAAVLTTVAEEAAVKVEVEAGSGGEAEAEAEAAAAVEVAVEAAVIAAVDEGTGARPAGELRQRRRRRGGLALSGGAGEVPRAWLVLQSGPAQPCTQRHAPPTHAPRPVHAPGQSEAWHDGPPQPRWHAQRPVCGLHLPCPLQSPGQRLPSSTDGAVAGSSAGDGDSAGEVGGEVGGGLEAEGDATAAGRAAACEPSGAEQSLPPQPRAQRQPPPPPHAPPFRHGYGQAGAAQVRPP